MSRQAAHGGLAVAAVQKFPLSPQCGIDRCKAMNLAIALDEETLRGPLIKAAEREHHSIEGLTIINPFAHSPEQILISS